MADTALILGLAGIGGTMAAGIGGQYLAGRLARSRDRERFEHEERLADRDELRARLDDAADVLQRAIAARHDVYARVAAVAGLTAQDPALERALQDPALAREVELLSGAAEDLGAMADRIAMRLTVLHDLYAAFENAGGLTSSAASDVWRLIAVPVLGEDPAPVLGDAQAALNAAAEAQRHARHTLTVEARRVVPTRLL